jgi:Protein of unknown function (DUF2911)
MKHVFQPIIFLAAIVPFITGCNNNEEKPAETNKIFVDSSRFIAPRIKENPYRAVDISMMDMSYFPEDYPIQKMAKKTNALPRARVIYSRPFLQGRKLFQNLLKYGEMWRLGANEATELDLYVDATIQDKKIKAGRYILYCIPEADKWIIVLNTNIDSWGLQPDSQKDIARFSIPVKQTANQLEYFTMVFEKTKTGADLLMAWDQLEARLPFHF